MSLRVFILGILCEGNHHPYDIKKMFKRDNMDDVYKINDGTLYYTFEVLLKKDCIEKIEVLRDENRPEKTTYGITDKGRTTLEQEIYTNFKNFKDIQSLYSSTLFLKHTDLTKLGFIIEEGIAKVRDKIQRNHDEWDTIANDTPQTVHLIQDHVLRQMELEVEWLEKLLVHVRGHERI